MMTRWVLLNLLSVVVLKTVSSEIYRLPTSIKPIRYVLTLEPYLNFSKLYTPIPYDGSVEIELDVLESTTNITFHKKILEIDEDNIQVIDSNGKALKVVETFVNEIEDAYTVQVEKELTKNAKYTIKINSFHNNLTEDGLGFFKAYYGNNDKDTGEEDIRVLAATHFQPAGARVAFPCFDEPALKAKFVVRLIRKEGFNSLSNGELDSTEDLGDGRYKDTFKETPVMSTYTLAFAVTQYKSASLGKFRIFAHPNSIDNNETDYALDISVKTLKALEEYTGIDFVINKMDQLAVPDGYFRYHAMENWGLVIYGESHLLRSKGDSASDYQRTTCYIAHEFAHQWFGNLATPAWWDYIWIGESFAAYFQYHTAAVVEPTWKLQEQFVVDVVHEAFRKEETSGAHPLNYRIQFSGQYPPFHIMYEKGSTIVRMMEHFLTPEVFRKGLNIYLTKNKFKAAFPTNLYDALEEAVDITGSGHLLNNMTVNEIMTTWDSTRGFPIITVKRNYETGSITIEQKSKFDKNITRIVPINFVFSSTSDFSKTSADLWLTEKSVTINNNFSTDGWLIVNKQQTGYYRVNYDLENWERIINYINSDKFNNIHVLNRAQLLDDAFKLAKSGEIPWDIPLRLSEYIKLEREYAALAAFDSALDNYLFIFGSWYYRHTKATESVPFQNHTLMNSVDSDATELDLHKAYIQNVLGWFVDDLGTSPRENDTHLDKLSRSKLMHYYYYYLAEPGTQT